MSNNKAWALAVAAAAVFAASLTGAEQFPMPLPEERIPNVASLPEHYPPAWAFLNYSGNRIELRNVGSDRHEVKGNLPARDSTTLLVSEKRPELYVADTVWSRGTYGARTDFIAVYDRKTLGVIGEIVLPTKRGLMPAMEGMFSFTDAERLALVFNFTPASSVTVVDLVKRKVIGEVEIPGCSLTYATGERGFSTLCEGGTLMTVRLDADGKVIARSESKPFNVLDTDPLFPSSAIVGGVHYFASMLGSVRPIDMRKNQATILPEWSLLTADDAAGHWRPSGWQVVAGDDGKLLYVLMLPDGHEGTQKDPGTEVWVFDTAMKTRIKRVRLVRPGSSIALTHEAEPLLLVQAEARLDVYDSKSGAWVRTMGLPGFNTRMFIQPLH